MIAAQFANPRGLLGRLIGRTMARANAHLTRRVVAALELTGAETVAEFGPGPGVGLALLAARVPTGRVIGVEPSPVMRAQAGARTRRLAPRVELLDATAATADLPGSCLDAAVAVNNVQLWDPLPASLAHVLTLLRPGGTLALGVTEHAVRPDGGSAGRHYDQELLPHLTAAGFTGVTAAWEPGGNGHELLVTARRPHAP